MLRARLQSPPREQVLNREIRVQNLLSLWANFSLARRAVIVGATLAMFLAVLGLARMAGQTNMALLYSGLDPAAAGQVVSALDQQGVKSEIRGDSIFVDETLRDSLRMTLAAQGLPETAGTGYELLDNLSGFGTTSQMFDAAYWRAKEGELARTILALPSVKAARVHIAEAPTQVFQNKAKPSASVTVTARGVALTAEQAQAIRHLVAGAVSGLQPEDVAVIDSTYGLIASQGDAAAPSAAGDAKAEEIKANIEHLLAARVGPNAAVVEVTVSVVTDREEVNERTLDPKGKVAISTDTQNNSETSTGKDGSVTVASNLPTGSGGASGSNQSQTNTKSERVNFDVSETTRQVIKLPGAVSKLSVAVLVDQEKIVAADGSVTFKPRSDAELATLKELVASAVGLDLDRGDNLTLKSLPFKQLATEGTLAEAGLASVFGQINVLSMLQLAVLALVALVMGLFVLRPLLVSSSAALPRIATTALPLALPGKTADGQVLTGEIDDGGTEALAEGNALEAPALAEIHDPIARLNFLIEERQAESIEILRSWMEYDEEAA
ncbi:MAG: flagellar basal-body MS-ring/collar protein FliF [Pseudomonadota bacterium]